MEIQSIDTYNTTISVYDILGKVVLEKPLSLRKGLSMLQLDCTNFAKGTYLLRYADIEGRLHTTKFVKD